MARSDDLYSLPEGLPEPVDDGACDHLTGMSLPSIPLMSTDGDSVDLARLTGTTVLFIYPRTGTPDSDPPPGWDMTPGMRGCTPQACRYRDSHAQFQQHGVRLFGLSSQESSYQQEMATRLHLPFPILSDADFRLANTLRLPTIEISGMTVIKRITLVIKDGVIRKVFYPVFPPDKNADRVLAWLSEQSV